jgi:signal transduction histidine kinase
MIAAERGARHEASAVGGEAIDRVLGWFVAAAGPDARCVRIVLPDRAGRLSVAAVHGVDTRLGRLSSRRRRHVFDGGQAVRIEPGDRDALALFIEPLSDGRSVKGLIEIVGPLRSLEARLPTIRAVVEPAAALLTSEESKRSIELALATMTMLVDLSGELLQAETPVAALRSATDVVSWYTGRPALAARPDRSGTGWFLAATAGAGSRRRSRLRAVLQDVVTASSPEAQHRAVAEAFRQVSSATNVETIRVGDALLVLADPDGSDREFVASVARVLSSAVERSATVGWARLLNENLDRGIAWTAHELKGPLVGAQAALEQILFSGNEATSRDVLLRMRDEMGHLTELVDPLLRWSAGIGSLEIGPCELVSVVRSAVDSCVLDEGDDDRVVVTAPERLPIRGDASQLRSAVANLVRNALAYSPPGMPVRVDVNESSGYATVCVRDRGPGVDPDERDLIFDPFVRGTVGGAVQGKGLGLFIARRVVEAHGGSIALRARRSGATFCIELPTDVEGRQRSAS